LNGNYPNYLNSRLVSPLFLVPDSSEFPRLRFWHWYSIWGGDWARVEIKVVGGNWVPISPTYDQTGGGIWTYPSIDLLPFAGETVQITFRLVSNSSNTSSGWYIDDVEIVTGPLVFNNPEVWDFGIRDWHTSRGTWEVGVATSGPDSCLVPPNCAATILDGNYANYTDTRLISPPFLVPPASETPILRFWHWYSIWGGDYGEVQIRIKDGPWQRILGPYDQGSGGWFPTSELLFSYADSLVQIAFHFVSNSSNTSSGWYIDSLEITGFPTNIEDWIPQSEPIDFNLSQNYPNPFNPSTTISYQLPRSGKVELKIYNMLGQEVRKLVDENQAAGQYTVQWDGRNYNGKPVASGVYLYRLKAGEFVETKKMLLLR
jgi:hypothetical protein